MATSLPPCSGIGQHCSSIVVSAPSLEEKKEEEEEDKIDR